AGTVGRLKRGGAADREKLAEAGIAVGVVGTECADAEREGRRAEVHAWRARGGGGGLGEGGGAADKVELHAGGRAGGRVFRKDFVSGAGGGVRSAGVGGSGGRGGFAAEEHVEAGEFEDFADRRRRRGDGENAV